MAIRRTVVSFALFCLLCAGVKSQSPPVYGSTYRVAGTIRLPYAEIVEPFLAYYDGPNNRSRIDFYNGTQITIQKAKTPDQPYGVTSKIVPFTNQTVYNMKRCFSSSGSSGAPVTIQSVIPDLTGFKYQGTVVIGGQKVNSFQKVVKVGKKTNTYTFLASASSNAPVRYEMMGYDSLFGSHYDKYYVDYQQWDSSVRFNDSDFAVPNNMSCGDFPGPGVSHSAKNLMNPIREFVNHEDDHVHEKFEDFKKEHSKQYSQLEHESRKHIFRQNLRYINSKNRAGLTFTMSVNHLADKSDKEMKNLRGFRYSGGNRGGKVFSWKEMTQMEIPPEWNWRLRGAVNPVKDQAICGSCWSFGTTGTIEGANFLKTGNLVRLSQQELMDCSWAYGNNGCDGGEDFRAYDFIMKNGGLTTESQYGQYLAIDGMCKSKSVKPVVNIANFTTLPQGDLKALQVAIFNKGPISVAIDASHKSFGFYSNGVYYEPQCRSDPDSLDHAVLAVGYGVMDGQAYWLVKNSWSTYWGNDGYVLMSQKDNNCGVATDATYVVIE